MRAFAKLAILVAFCGFVNLAGGAFGISSDNGFIRLDSGTGLRAVIAPGAGGELTGLSIRMGDCWHELLYRAMDYSDRPGWRGKTPLLWPATGISLTGPGQDKTYKLGETNYPMPFHGFARHASWQVIKQSESAEMTSLTLRLADSEESRRYYPFAFELEVEYRLLKDRLSLLYRVTAGEGNSMAMPFSIGNHITFNAPLIEGSKASQLEFENTFPNQLITGSDKAFAGEIIASPFRGRRSLSELPNRTAVSLGGIEGAAELTIHDPSGLQLKMVHESSLEAAEPSIQFNLWADTNAGFFSPEPWVGTQNSLNTGFGLVTLQPGESWRWKIDILPTVHKH